MNDYMRENKIETVTPVLVAQGRGSAPARKTDADPVVATKAATH